MAKKEDAANGLHEAEKDLFQAEAGIKYHLARFGDALAKREGYRNSDNKSLDAIRFYLMEKHHWTPATVLSMSDEHLAFAMREERAGGTSRRKDRS